MHVPNIHWIVADDRQTCNPVVESLLRRTGVPFTYMTSPMPEIFRHERYSPKGVANRIAALRWIHKNIKNGVIYFGDDDNTFDLMLFDEIRSTKKISMFPVGLIGKYGVSSPVVRNGKVIGFFDPWPAKRMWPVDMAGFAINLGYLKENATMPFKAGYEEDGFLRNNNISLDDIEPKANNCSQVLVWHTQLRPYPLAKIMMNLKNFELNELHSNLPALLNEIKNQGMGLTFSSKGENPYITKDGKSVLFTNT